MGCVLRLPPTHALTCALAAACIGDTNAPSPEAIGAIQIGFSVAGSELGTTYDIVIGGRTASVNRETGTTIAGLPTGVHFILVRLPANCQVAGQNPRPTTVVANDTTPVLFQVTCVAATGWLRVATATTGVDIDPSGYTVRVESTPASIWSYFRIAAVGTAGTVTLERVPRGNVLVTLTGLSVNCDAAGANPRAVPIVPAETVAVSFDAVCAPANNRLAYVAAALGSSGDIHVVDADGKNGVRLTTDGLSEEPAWSPDGTRLAFTSRRDVNREIYVVDADGLEAVRLTTSTSEDYHPTWSPDGNRIAFVSNRDGNAEIYLMNADGSSPIRLTDHAASDVDPAWSPDGRRIAFTSERTNSRAEVYVMDVTGSNFVRVSTEGGQHPAWAPDGNTLAYAAAICSWYSYVCPPFLVVRPGTGNPFHLTSVTGARPTWSPDGRKVAYNALSCDFYYTVCGHDGVWIARADGTDVFGKVASGHGPAWRP